MLDNSIATCVATILPQLRVASKVNDSKLNEVHDSKVKVQEQVQEVQEQVQEVHDSKIKVQEQVQEVHGSQIKVHEQVRYGTAKTFATTWGFPRLESIRLHRLRDKQAMAMLPHLGRWCYHSALYSSTACLGYMVVL